MRANTQRQLRSIARRRAELDSATVLAVLRARDEGQSLRAIAQELGTSHVQVGRIESRGRA